MWWQPIIGVVVGAILTYMIMRRLQKSEIRRGVRERRLLELEDFVDEEVAMASRVLNLRGSVKELEGQREKLEDRVSRIEKRIAESKKEPAKALSDDERQVIQEEFRELRIELDNISRDLNTRREMVEEVEKYLVSPEYLKTQGKIGKGSLYDEELDRLVSNFQELENSIAAGDLTSSTIAQLEKHARLIRERIDFLISKG